jgi:hypothetical protein
VQAELDEWAGLRGSQTPTYLWVPPYDYTDGPGAAELAASAGLVLDPYQKMLLDIAFALDPSGALLCFEIAVILSRQNGKNTWLEALELAWLFLFGEQLVLHSAHLFETSREHFLRMYALIVNNPDFDCRVWKIKEGRGAEEIILKLRDPVTGSWIGRAGARLKFQTRKGGAGRGFVGGKLVMDEAMYLDATAMAAGVPTMATMPGAQIVYTGSAGLKHSTQLAAVRRRGYQGKESPAEGDPSLALIEWAADKAVYDQDGVLIAGDDPSDPRTIAKVNPALGTRITLKYVRQEARTLGGYDSTEFGTERLGIGDWPEDDQRWEVVGKKVWENQAREGSKLGAGLGRVYAIDVDGERNLGTVGLVGWREDGRVHIETKKRARGSAWIPDYLGEIFDEHGKAIVICLKANVSNREARRLRELNIDVEQPTDVQYMEACADIVEGLASDEVVHLGQPSMTTAVGGAAKRGTPEGGWRWAREGTTHASPIICATLGLWGLRLFGPLEDTVGDVW